MLWSPKNPVYKFVDAADAHFLEQGSLKIGTLRSFARLEGKRADEAEGSATINVPLINSKADFDCLNAMQSLVHIEDEGGGRMINCQINETVPDLYCMCFSEVSQNSYFDEDGEQAIFEVANPMRFASLVGARQPELGKFVWNTVEYRARDVVFNQGNYTGPSPFVKPPAYKEEAEVRVIWQPTTVEPKVLFTPPSKKVAALLRRIK